MKSICNLFMMAVFSLSLGLAGCVKEDPAKPLEIDWSRTAKIEGTFLINWDVSSLDPLDQVYSPPDITNESFVVTIDYWDLISRVGGTYYLPKKHIIYVFYVGITRGKTTPP